MKKKETILFLGPSASPLHSWLKTNYGNIVQTTKKITPEFITENRVTFLISYGYRYILKKNILDLLPNRAINLHISLLPWNRGADPNFWSFIDDTPKGVTIHYMDAGIDTGDIIVQKELEFDSKAETLLSAYNKLNAVIQRLFKLHWDQIYTGTCPRTTQPKGGSFHKLKDKKPLDHLLVQGWETIVSVLEEYGSTRQVPRPLLNISKLNLRKADKNDCRLLYEWRNDIHTREASINTEEITFSEHNEWFMDTLNNPSRVIYIAEYSGDRVGTCRADYDGSMYELSWTVSPEFRKKGFGKLIVKKAADMLDSTIIAKIKQDNEASNKIAEFAGFSVKNYSEGVGIWEIRK